MFLDKNIYGLALLIRGHCESTAILGYFCNRFESFADGNITFEVLEWDVSDAIMGSKHEVFSEANDPRNILTYLEKADKYLDKNYFEKKIGMLQDCYDWLSEYTHPNFLSNKSAFVLDKPNRRCVFQHGKELDENDIKMFGYLEISSGLFVVLFDAFARQVPDGRLGS